MQTILIIAASGLLFVQSVVSGGSDPEEAKRGVKMILQNDQMIALNGSMRRQGRIAIAIAGLALLISLIALFRSH